MKVMEVIKHSYHKIKSDANQFRQNMGVRNLTTAYGPRGEADPKPKNKLIQVLGHGAYATAVANTKDSNRVMKISRGTDNLNDDPYYSYLSSIAAYPEMENNPFIPRVFQVKVYETTDKAHKYFYIVTMERLYELRSLNEQELIRMILSLTKAKMTVRFKAALGGTPAPDILKQQSHGELLEILVDKIRKQKIIDPQLQAAMKLAENTGFDFDITAHNIMVRKTINGPQLVLADPIKN